MLASGGIEKNLEILDTPIPTATESVRKILEEVAKPEVGGLLWWHKLLIAGVVLFSLVLLAIYWYRKEKK